VLVNLADLGGAPLVHAHGGFELMLGLLRTDDLSVRYYAVAGVQNMSATAECAVRVRGTPVELLLEEMLECANPQIERCAAGALANIRRAAREARPPVPTEASDAAHRPGAPTVPGSAALGSALGALAGLPAASLGLLSTVATLPFRSFWTSTPAQLSEAATAMPTGGVGGDDP
jgi:hypothetical protein